jgi:tetratricopeptide (TPR) repeat protein
MSRALTRTVAAAVALAVAAAAAATYVSRHPRATPSRTAPSEAEIRDRNIEFYAARARRDPTGGFDLARLAALYLRRSREMGSYDDLLRAERAARRSLGNRKAHNAAAAQVLVSSLLAQHHFPDALDAARRLVRLDPGRASYRAMLGEIALELGRYDEADAVFSRLGGRTGELAVASRIARWHEIEGRTANARRVIDTALRAALQRRDLPREQLAWFWWRRGDLEFREGRVDAAAYAFHQGLTAHPGDYRLRSALARLAAVRHRWRDAIAGGERSVAAGADPATLGTLSDAYAALGDTARASAYARAMEAVVRRQSVPYERVWSLFLLDHDRRVPEVYETVRAELRTRRDIYGWDVLAWALHKLGRDVEARDASRVALSRHTRDAMLHYHAGMIAYTLGDDATARTELTTALAINPYFHHTQPDEARRALECIDARSRPRPRPLGRARS